MKKDILENHGALMWDEFTLIKWLRPVNKRYYYAYLEQDLLGDLIVTQKWGGIGSRKGGHKLYYCATKEQAQQYIKKLAKRRKQRGYFLEK